MPLTSDNRDRLEIYDNFRADFETALETNDTVKAREIIIGFSEYSMDEAKRWEQELKESELV